MIYFIQCGTNGPIKIGYTDNGAAERMAQLQTGCPYELKLLWVYSGDDYTEAQIHTELSHERVRGEWFHPSPSVFEFINNEIGNRFEINSPNGRAIKITERFDAFDEINFNTRLLRSGTNRRKFTTIFHNHATGDMGIDPADFYVKVDICGQRI